MTDFNPSPILPRCQITVTPMVIRCSNPRTSLSHPIAKALQWHFNNHYPFPKQAPGSLEPPCPSPYVAKVVNHEAVIIFNFQTTQRAICLLNQHLSDWSKAAAASNDYAPMSFLYDHAYDPGYFYLA